VTCQEQQIHFWCDLPRRYCIRTCALGARSKLASHMCVCASHLNHDGLVRHARFAFDTKPTKTFIERTYLVLGYICLREIAHCQTRWSVAATVAARRFEQSNATQCRGTQNVAATFSCTGNRRLMRAVCPCCEDRPTEASPSPLIDRPWDPTWFRLDPLR
jgi:hypothetical protein